MVNRSHRGGVARVLGRVKLVKPLILFLVPIASIGIFFYYVWTAGGPFASAWGSTHGIDVSIVNNYRNVNSISLAVWVAVFIGVIGRWQQLAQMGAVFACGFVLCDVIFYFPMARLAGEAPPFDQLTIWAVQVAYALSIPALLNRGDRRNGAPNRQSI